MLREKFDYLVECYRVGKQFGDILTDLRNDGIAPTFKSMEEDKERYKAYARFVNAIDGHPAFGFIGRRLVDIGYISRNLGEIQANTKDFGKITLSMMDT